MSVHKKTVSRIGALLLALVMMLSLLPTSVLATGSSAEETTYVLAGSDFQARSGNAAGATIVNGVIDQIKADSYTKLDGFLFAGDYSVGATKAADVTYLKDTIRAAYPELTDDTMVLIQGNHDNASEYSGAEAGLVGNVIDVSGAHDAENYGVFVINEQDYMWRNSNETTIKNTAASLKGYLDAKRNAEYAKPIFVVSHLPLHYCMRTNNDGDGMYANYIFDVLNEAGNAGLNIIFMFGHNHSHGWDDYLGGAAIFLTKGDKINIAQSSKTAFKEETLAFTYLNAGYVGYYGDSYTSDVDKTLTMTTFAITDNDVTISRYSANGTHNLKSAGVYNVEHPDNSKYSTDTTTVGSPYTLTLNKEITPAGEEVTPPTGGSTTERTYTLVTSETELVSGDQYLLIYNGTQFVLPEIVTKSNDSGSQRTGMDLEATDVASGGPATITGQYQAKEWQLVSSSGGWLLSNGTQKIKLTNTNDLGITATFEDAGSPFSLNFNTSHLVSFTHGNWELNYNSRGLINGYDSSSDAARMYIYRLTDAGSDAPTVETEDKGWVKIKDPSSGTTSYIYKLDTDGVNAGKKYLIVNTASDGTAYALTNNDGDVDKTQVTVRDGQIAVEDDTNINWVFSNASNGTVTNQNRYLYPKRNSLTLDTSSSNLTISSQGNGAYRISRYLYYVRYNSNEWTTSIRASNVYLFVYDSEQTSGATPGLYASIEGELSYEVAVGTSKDDALAAVKAGITGKTSAEENGAEPTTELDDSALTWTLDPAYDGVTPGEYAVTISYEGKTLGIAKVVVPSVSIKGYTVAPMTGSVMKGVSQSKETGAYIVVTLENGDYYRVPVTVSMLTKADGSAVSTGEEGTYKDLTVTYNGRVITENFTLHVTAKSGNNYPEYPNPGAVKVDKTGTGIDFQSTGVAQVEISASGVPVEMGADVIVMLDLSSSMNTTVTGQTQSRLEVLKDSLRSMLGQLQNSGGDIRIAVADFNIYYNNSSSPYYLNAADTVAGGSIRTNDPGSNTVYTGSRNLNAGAFVDVNTLATTAFDTIATASGTNYDYAFDAVYQLGAAITEQNATNGEERKLFVVFMSDGAPFQFNYFSSQSSGTGAAEWNNWLTGTLDTADIDNGANASYYNEDGKHWMAEAIKGDPAITYPVIRKNNAADTDGDNWVEVNGLGATMFSIGFCLAVDKDITVDTMDTVIRNIASDETHYFRAGSADDLNTAFSQIGSSIAYAANNARFVDQMGDDYNLQMAVSNYAVVDGSSTTDKTITPKIEIISYDIYTRQDYLNGTITENKIGDRKGTYTVLETVTFNPDGTEAYSDQIGENINILADGSQAGHVKGVIYAKYFIYNTNATAVAVEGVSIPTGTKADGTTTGSTNMLPSETFYWKMGTVQTSELAMRYYVYLTGSMEGTREAGSYPTNEYATLYYDNYLGNPCKKDTVSPVMPWKEANVSYAFYLVNEDGDIVVNQTTGKTGSFANKIAVTNPVVYDTVLLNTSEKLDAVQAARVLPEGYTLYDGTYDSNGNLSNGATYTVTVNSDSTGSWEITSVKDVATTYVVNYDPDNAAAYSKDKSKSQIGHDYTHTTVWFAVVWKVQALPDTVVVDYGLPVDISVLTNDMFGENGKLAGIGAMEDMPEGYNVAALGQPKLATRFGTTYQGEYGDATADLQTGVVRYKLNTMQVNGYERFAYAVNYTGATNPGYYYDTVTVIPATTIYYEDDFVTTKSYTWNNGWTEVTKDDAAWTWSTFGTTVNGTQDEDRPGKYSLTDANNIYGYDSANLNMSTFSMGSALKATVDYDNYAVAEFSFYGTGFDVISMTSNTTGTIVVKVVDASGKTVRNVIVDTYYGYKTELHYVTYTYTNGEWVKAVGDMAADGTSESKVDTTTAGVEGETRTGVEYVWVIDPNADDSIYQVPVIKIENLRYGQYKVEISAMYDTSFDHVAPSYETGSYDFYLDAIRIYDPANDGAADGADDTTIEDAYKADGEGWPSYFELRNMVIDNKTLGNADTSTKIDGLVFIDGDAAVGDAQISDYKNYGPNNEIYLAPGQSVAFILTYPTNVDRVHIGIKAADGNTATYTITNIARQDIAGTNVKAGNYYASKTFTMNTATEMYYDLTGWIKKANNATQSDIIVISNTGNLEVNNTTGILSLTNIKFTYTSDPNATATVSDENGTGVASYRLSGAPVTYSTMATSDELTASDGTEATVSNEGSVYMTAEAAVLAVRGINAMYAPEEPELEAFEPEKLDVNIRTGEVKVGDKVKVVVRSSDDVDYITVNGKTITRYKTDRRTGERTWTVELRAEEAGEMAVEIIAYNEAELASEAVTVTAAVREKKNQRDLIRKLFDWLFG